MSLQFRFGYIFTFVLLIRSSSVASPSNAFRSYPSFAASFTAQERVRKDASYRLSKPLVGDDGRVYSCLGKNLLAFESNGSMTWTLPLNYTCDTRIAPVHGGVRKLYLVAENRVLKISTLKIGTSESAVELFFGPEPGEILGISVSTSTSCVIINVKKRGLFAYRLHGQLLWSGGPVLYQSGYRQGCTKNLTNCYFSSVPVIDQCESSIYISNNEGELYALSVRSPHFKWIQDFSTLDRVFTVTPGNNGRLYVTVPSRTLILALDVSRGTVLWQRSIGPLSSMDIEPVVDTNGWISIGSLDGYLYSFSPTGILKKFPKTASVDNKVIQVSPVLDCSGYAVYISRTEMEGKISHTISEYTYVSVRKPINVVFSVVVPARGSMYWSESYTGPFLSLLSQSDLQHFAVDERILLAFVSASNTGNPLPCRSPSQKLESSCSQAMPNRVNIYTGNERAIMLFLSFESGVLIILAAVVGFCCMFWKKKKLQSQDLGKFLEKRRSLQLQKKEYDRTIRELEKTAADEANADQVLEEMTNLVRERDSIERKLSTTYSLGRDRGGGSSNSSSLLPLYDDAKMKSKSYSFRGTKKENVTIFHTLSDTGSSSGDSMTDNEANLKESCSEDNVSDMDYMASVSSSNSGSKGDEDVGEMEVFEGPVKDSVDNGSSSRSMRRRAFSSSI